jgi:hypothetical protein
MFVGYETTGPRLVSPKITVGSHIIKMKFCHDLAKRATDLRHFAPDRQPAVGRAFVISIVVLNFFIISFIQYIQYEEPHIIR